MKLCNIMFSRITLLVYFYVIYLYTSLTEAASVIDIHRSECRKDTLMKATDRDKKLTATASNIISKLHENSLSLCTMKCVKNERCVSINYKKSFANGEEKNCELLDVNKTSSSVTVSNENGWIHYEPVIQPGPRCRLVSCNAGFECNERCNNSVGYDCIEIDECRSNPCPTKHICIDGTNEYTCEYDACSSSPCENGAKCTSKQGSFICLCAQGYSGIICRRALSTKFTSCKQIHDATGWRNDGVYTLWNKALTQRYNAYCHMAHGGWTLIARFSNVDAKNWMQSSGHYWYDQLATGDKTNPYTNADMINEAFYEAPGGQIKFSKTSNPLTWIMYTVSSCLGSATFRSKITSYGNFRNNAWWSRNACKGRCKVVAYSGASGVSGFSQYLCSSTLQANNYIGFWCHYGTGDASVMMIGGGGSSCARADHGIGVTEANSPQFGSLSETTDFGDSGYGSGVQSYGLNLWIK